MRLLIYGHWSHTGFGIVTEALAARFVAAGLDVRIIAVNHRGEPVRGPLAGRVWPASISGEPFGGNISAAAITGQLWRTLDREDDWAPEQVLVISDVSGLFGHLGNVTGDPGAMAAWRSLPVWHYCPIEGDNLPIGWRGVWDDFAPVAMSRYGARIIGEHIGRDVPVIYHGVETTIFRPVTFAAPIRHGGLVLRTKADCKRAFGLDPDRLVILRSDRLVERKFYDRMFAALPAILAAVPSVDVVLHCQPVDEGGSLYDEVGRLPAEFRPRVKITNAHDTWRGLSTEGMAALANAADLYLSTTGGEGFGLNLAESLACEVPVVVTDWAAEREVVGPGGVLVPPLHDVYGEPVRYHSRYGMDWAVPDPRAYADPVIRLLRKPAERRALGQAGRRHVVRSFNWDTAASEFLALFGSRTNASAVAV